MQRHLGRFLIGGLGAWNVVVNRLLPAKRYVPANLAAAVAVYLVGRAAGADNRQLGLSPSVVRSGARVGLAGAAAIGAAVVAASRLPVTKHLFEDARAAERSIAYESLVRIPLGTVVLEEVVFRSVLPAVLDGAARQRVALGSAALFGLWHILPTQNTLDINGVMDHSTRSKAVMGGVVATAAAALALDKVRLRTGSIAAPMVMHWAANTVSYVIAARRV